MQSLSTLESRDVDVPYVDSRLRLSTLLAVEAECSIYSHSTICTYQQVNSRGDALASHNCVGLLRPIQRLSIASFK